MARRGAWLFAIAGGVVAAGLGLRVLWGHRASRGAAGDPHRWPGQLSVLRPVATRFSAEAGAIRVAIDPGHGAPGNRGNTSSYCVEEQDAMLALGEAVAGRLQATGHVKVRLLRDAGHVVTYADRVEEARAWGADAFVSLHSDVRGKLQRWSPAPGRDCPLSLDAPGFAILYSDEGDAALASRRALLGRALARRMIEAGFLPYDGAEYAGIYAPDADERGVFADRHAPEQRIFVLRRAAMPSILVETHNAVDSREAARWAEPATVDAFASAVAAALYDAIGVQRGT